MTYSRTDAQGIVDPSILTSQKREGDAMIPCERCNTKPMDLTYRATWYARAQHLCYDCLAAVKAEEKKPDCCADCGAELKADGTCPNWSQPVDEEEY